MLAEAAILLALVRMAELVLPFRVIARHLGDHMAESDTRDDPYRLAVGRRIGWAVRAISNHVPWRAKCLEQALAAKAMLRIRHISNTMYLGVAPGGDPHSPLDAHAWLRTGNLHVTGGSHVDHYTVMSTFADRGDRSRRAVP